MEILLAVVAAALVVAVVVLFGHRRALKTAAANSAPSHDTSSQSSRAPLQKMAVLQETAPVAQNIRQPQPPEPESVIPPPKVEEPPLNFYLTRELFRQKYQNLAAKLPAKNKMKLLDKQINVFSLWEVRVSHYCWKSETAIHAFPVWESIEPYLNDPAVLSKYERGDENNISVLTFPLTQISTFSTKNGVTVLKYYNSAGALASTIFLGDAESVFRQFIPHSEERYLKRQKYLRSSSNITDLKQELQQLQERFQRNEITKEEYEAQKLTILLMK